MAEGRSNAAIAQRLFITEQSNAKHTASIFHKLDLPRPTTTTAASSPTSDTRKTPGQVLVSVFVQNLTFSLGPATTSYDDATLRADRGWNCGR